MFRHLAAALLYRNGFVILTLLMLFVAPACSPVVATRGQMVDEETLAGIKVGFSTREDVANKLGTPLETGAFDDKVWYYIGEKTEQNAFLPPNVVARSAVAVRFNDDGVVTSLDKLDTNATAENITPSTRKTETYGRNSTVAEQLLGNIGRPGGRVAKQSKK